MKYDITIEGSEFNCRKLIESLCLIDGACLAVTCHEHNEPYQAPIRNWPNHDAPEFLIAIAKHPNYRKITGGELDYIILAFKERNIIKLIKAYKAATEAGLKESKDWVENYLAS